MVSENAGERMQWRFLIVVTRVESATDGHGPATTNRTPLRFIAIYHAKAERDGNRQLFIALVHASARHAHEAPNSFEGEAWCDSVARQQDGIAHWFHRAPSGLLPADLRPGDVRFDWIVEDAYGEVMFPVSLAEESSRALHPERAFAVPVSTRSEAARRLVPPVDREHETPGPNRKWDSSQVAAS